MRVRVDVKPRIQVPQGNRLETQVIFYVATLKQISFFRKPESLLSWPSTNRGEQLTSQRVVHLTQSLANLSVNHI